MVVVEVGVVGVVVDVGVLGVPVPGDKNDKVIEKQAAFFDKSEKKLVRLLFSTTHD